MNTMTRTPTTPQTSMAASSLTAGGRPVAAGIHRGIWIGGGLMALTIVALATALVVKSNGPDSASPVASTATPMVAAPATPDVATVAPPPVLQNESAANPPVVNSSVAQAPQVTPAPVRTVHHHRPIHSTPSSTGNISVASNGGPVESNANPDFDTPPRSGTGIAPVACPSCGVVDSYDAVQVQGQANGVGAVAGGVGGALLGSQIAGRHNHTLGGVIGAIGGGLLGNTIEKHERTTTVYDVHVRMNDGSTRTVRQSTVPAVGASVRIEGHTLHPVSAVSQ